MSDDIPPAWAQAMESRLAGAVGDRIGAAEDALLEALEERLTGAMAALRRDLLAHMDDRTAGIMERLDRLQGDLEHQLRDGVVAFGTAETALRRNTTTREDLATLTDMVLAMNHRMQRLEAELRQLRGEGEGA